MLDMTTRPGGVSWRDELSASTKRDAMRELSDAGSWEAGAGLTMTTDVSSLISDARLVESTLARRPAASAAGISLFATDPSVTYSELQEDLTAAAQRVLEAGVYTVLSGHIRRHALYRGESPDRTGRVAARLMPMDDLVADELATGSDEALRRVLHRPRSEHDTARTAGVLTDQLLRALEAEPIEDGRCHVGEDTLAAATRLLGGAVDNWLAGIADRARNPAERAAILRLAGRCGLPGGGAARRHLVNDSLASSHVEVRDAAVQAAESWEDPSLVEVLEAHREPVAWLADYIAQVLDDLRR